MLIKNHGKKKLERREKKQTPKQVTLEQIVATHHHIQSSSSRVRVFRRKKNKLPKISSLSKCENSNPSTALGAIEMESVFRRAKHTIKHLIYIIWKTSFSIEFKCRHIVRWLFFFRRIVDVCYRRIECKQIFLVVSELHGNGASPKREERVPFAAKPNKKPCCEIGLLRDSFYSASSRRLPFRIALYHILDVAAVHALVYTWSIHLNKLTRKLVQWESRRVTRVW